MAEYIGLDGAKFAGSDVYNTAFDMPLNYAMIANEFGAETVQDLINSIKFKGACCGSGYLSKETKIPSDWYNFIWIPHRMGGQGGGDNMNYGTLCLIPMTLDNGYGYFIRYDTGQVIYRRFSLTQF